jgi:ADP-ribose pyrophosphatase
MNKKLKQYLKLIEQQPELFANPDDNGTIRIITDPRKILAEQAKLRIALRKNNDPIVWAEIRVLVEDPWYIVIRDIVEFPDGTMGGYIRCLNRKSSIQGSTNVVILAEQNHQIILLQHFRHELRQFFWEVPRGFGEPGIDPDEMELIELDEEIKIRPSILVQTAFFQEGAGGTAYYYAKLPDNVSISGGFNEGIGQKIMVEVADLDEWIKTGRITDTFTLVAIFLAKLKGHI